MKYPDFHILPIGFSQSAFADDPEKFGQYLNFTPELLQKAKYFITLIEWINFISYYGKEVNENRWVQLSTNFLNQFLGKDYPRLVHDLLDNLGVIECDYEYSVGRKSYGYRLSPEFAGQATITEDIRSDSLRAKIERKNAEGSKAPRMKRGVYAYIARQLKLFSYPNDAQLHINQFRNRPKAHRQHCFNFIQNKNSFFSVHEESGRCFHALTSTPKKMREMLLINGEPTEDIDIPSSQPLLAATLYNQSDPAHVREMKEYISIIENSDFYMSLANAANSRLKQRKAIKTACYREIFFNRRASRGRLWRTMKAQFPILAELITAEKRKAGNAQFAHYLQSTESQIVIKTVGKYLADRKVPFATVHDSIICKRSHARIVRKQLKMAVEDALGVRVDLKF